MPVSQRKQLGAWYTPPALVAAVVTALDVPAVLAACGRRPIRVLDPACGDGRFLHAVGAAVAGLGGRVELTGVDVDPDVFACGVVGRDGRSTRGDRATWLCGDALAMTWEPGSFDVVVGNPPFLNQLATATTRGGSSRFGGGPYADVAAEFLAMAAQVVAAGGRIGLVLPQSLLSARDAAPIRADVDRRAALRWVWWSSSPVFDAAVRTWAAVWEAGGDPAPVARVVGPSFTPAPAVLGPVSARGSWSTLISSVVRPECDPGQPVLGSIASFLVDFRDTYYGLVGAVHDSPTGPADAAAPGVRAGAGSVDGPPLITSGLIEPGRCLWGVRPARFAKQRFAAPRVDLERLTPAMRRWADLRLVPKILIANQTRTIEAVHDPDGSWLPGVPVITCVTAEPEQVLAVLASDAATRWVQYHAAGSGLSAETVRLTPSLLASIPLPP
ncbi:MAG: hypothetical protein JWM12_1487 [Ilumatobacteraceae bacterium]|nr:hypothetical protein [Ilumatobacteraceae bacterium]